MFLSSGANVFETDTLKSGELVVAGSKIFIGTRHWTAAEIAGWEAKWIVNHGLRDVVRYIGEKPIRRHHPTYNRTWLELIRDKGPGHVDAMRFLS